MKHQQLNSSDTIRVEYLKVASLKIPSPLIRNHVGGILVEPYADQIGCQLRALRR